MSNRFRRFGALVGSPSLPAWVDTRLDEICAMRLLQYKAEPWLFNRVYPMKGAK